MKTFALNRRAFLQASFASAATVSLAACGKNTAGASKSGDTQASSKNGGTIKCAIDNPTSIDPYDIEEFNGAAVAFQLFDPLTYYDYSSEALQPLSAERWEPNETADVWTFYIKKGLKFHDGSDVTSRSFKFAWERLCNPKTGEAPSVVSYHLAMVKGYDEMLAGSSTELVGVSCPDDYTLKVELVGAYADFPFVVSCTPLAPVPESAKDDFAAYGRAPIGNGPFMMDGEWVDGQYINLKRFEDYGGDAKAHVDAINFNIYKNTDTAFREFEAGNLDLCDIPAGRIKDTVEKYGESLDGFTATKDHQTLLGQVLYTEYLAYNVEDPILSNPKVRQAMSLAINRQNICDSLYEGTATPAGDIVPPGIKGNDESTWRYCDYDVERAKKLLDEAGYPAAADGTRGISLSIMVNSSRSTDEFVILQGDWKAVGINVTIDQLEYAVMLDRYVAGTYQLGSRGWTADYPIMDNFLQPLMYTGVGDNVSHYSNPNFDAKLDEARRTEDEDQRIALMHEANVIAAEDMPIIPMVHKALNKVCSANFQDLKVDAARCPELREAKKS